MSRIKRVLSKLSESGDITAADVVKSTYLALLEQDGKEQFVNFVIGGLFNRQLTVEEEAAIICRDLMEGAAWIKDDPEWKIRVQYYYQQHQEEIDGGKR